MSINKKQSKLCDTFTNHANFWNFCEDIDSPSHYIDIEDSRELLIDDFDVSKDVAEEFASRLMDILNFIRNVH